MRRTITILAVLCGLALLVPAGAAAKPAASPRVVEPASVYLGVALPIFRVESATWVPPGFTSDGAHAIHLAETNRQMLAIHARRHPLQVILNVWLGRNWLVDFYYHTKIVAEVVVTKAGRLTGVWTGPLAIAQYARGDFAVQFGRIGVLLPFSLLFLLPFLDLRRLLSWRLADGLALLSFLVSYLLFDHAKLVAGVWFVYPPLAYLLGRMLWLGLRRRRGGAGAGAAARTVLSSVPLRVLGGGLLLLVIARSVLSLTSATVVDVGYASVIGAHQIATGHAIYFSSAAHGDTYGPIAYLAYLPFELLFPWHGAWNYLGSAHAASLVFDLLTIGGLIALGRRLRGGDPGWRLGLTLAWAWAACPFTLLALMMHTNDGLVALFSVLSLLVFASPAARGVVLGLAAAAKFSPAALIGLYAGGRRRSLREGVLCVAAFAIVVVVPIWLYLPPGGVSEFLRQTIGFQLHRTDVFSPWALYPGLEPVKLAVEVLAVLLCAAVTFVPRRRSLIQVSALAAAVTIAVQLPAIHWFYYYIVWFVPYVLVAVLGEEAEPDPLHAGDAREFAAPAPRELIAAGA